MNHGQGRNVRGRKLIISRCGVGEDEELDVEVTHRVRSE